MDYLLIISWLLCGFLHYGLWVGYFQGNYPLIAEDDWWKDRISGFILTLGGPISLLISLALLHPYQWRL